jgi:outer membrane protein OmpA-like peptidoglycan-associated protein
MPESLFASLLHSLDRSSISQIASTLGESEQGVSRGMEASIASVLGALSSKSDDPAALRRTLDLVPDNLTEVSWPKLTSALSNPGSPLIATGKKMISSLFGSGGEAVSNAVAREAGIGPAASSTLMTLAAPLLLGFLKKRVMEEGLSMRGLGAILHREGGAIRGALPAGVADLLWPAGAPAATGSTPVIAQSVQPERSYAGWVGALGLALLALGGLWLWSHARRVVPPAIGVPTVGEANRMAGEANRAGDTVRRTLPGNIGIDLPANGPEARLLAVIQGTRGNGNAWIDMNRLYFDSGSATLRADATEQLDNIAAILQAYPNAHLLIAGYTDDVGPNDKNLDLSKARAETVKDALVSRHVATDCLATEGYGEQNPAGDNSTDAGRAKNRRVLLKVTQR